MSYMIKNGKLVIPKKLKFHFIYAPLLALLLTLLVFAAAYILSICFVSGR